MCMYIKSGATPKIAEKNILCYKELDENNLSRVFSYRYIKGELQPKVNIRLQPTSDDEISIDDGYHSRNNNSRLPKKHLFIIPKGTLYYEGDEGVAASYCYNPHNNYVSEQIIYVGRNNWFNRLLVKIKYKL